MVAATDEGLLQELNVVTELVAAGGRNCVRLLLRAGREKWQSD
jgi:hypothetical protein